MPGRGKTEDDIERGDTGTLEHRPDDSFLKQHIRAL